MIQTQVNVLTFYIYREAQFSRKLTHIYICDAIFSETVPFIYRTKCSVVFQTFKVYANEKIPLSKDLHALRLDYPFMQL